MFLSVKALGVFRLVQSVFGVFNMLFNSIENFMIPEVRRRLLSSSLSAHQYLFSTFKKLALLAIPLVALMFIFPDFLIVLAGGEEFAGYGYTIRLMMIVYVLIFSIYPLRILIRVHLMNRAFLYAFSLSLICSLLFVNPLLSNFGLAGAFAGLALSQLCIGLYWFFSLRSKKVLEWKR